MHPPTAVSAAVGFLPMGSAVEQHENDFEEPPQGDRRWQIHDRVTTQRKRLLAAGYLPLPINGKVPSIPGWQDIIATPAIIDRWIDQWPDSMSTGLLTKATPAIDIDIVHAQAAAAVEALAREHFEERGRILVRFGRAPKRAILFRTDEPFKKIVRSFTYPNCDPKHPPKIEILAAGQQLVAAGIHPGTGKPYAWHGGEPGEIRREDLPYVREGEMRTFVDAAAELLVKEFGFTDQPKSNGKDDGEALDEEISPGWSYLVANILAGRELHDSIRDLAASVIASGVNDTAAERLLHALMQASTAPHDERWRNRYDDILRAVRSARGKFGQQEEQETWEDAAQPLPFIDMDRWDEELPPPRKWAVLDRFPLRQAALFSGEGAAGKSIVLLHLCAAHALARDWLQTLPEPGPAIFVDAEDEAAELHRRLADILDHYGVTFADAIKGGLHMMSFAGQDAVLAVPNRTGKIEPTALFKRFLQAAGDLKPKVFGIASSANVYAGSEIDRAQVQQFLSLMTKLAITANGAVVLITHPSLTGINTDTGLSGSTAWHNSVRARCYMKSIAPEEGQQPDTDLREISFKKNNYGPISANIVLRYQNGLFLPVSGMSSLDQAARDAKADDVFLKVLRHLSQQGQDLGPNRTASNYAPSVIAKHPDGKGYARMNSKPPSNACSTPTKSTSSPSVPNPNAANTSRPDPLQQSTENQDEEPTPA